MTWQSGSLDWRVDCNPNRSTCSPSVTECRIGVLGDKEQVSPLTYRVNERGQSDSGLDGFSPDG